MSIESEIKVTGEFMPDPNMCRFQVNQPLLPESAVVFNRAEEAVGSPLAEALFAIEGITRIKIAGSNITLSKNVPEAWPVLAKFILPAIKEPLLAEIPPISAEAIERMQLTPQGDMAQVIEQLLEQHINPALASHGGFVSLLKVEDNDVFIEMGGGCQGCAASKMTMKNGVETAIREVCPNVREVIDATDHTAGANPYYR
jgi:NFU1 iron-sulfur cluster scaffold homolog, mitochondrial